MVYVISDNITSPLGENSASNYSAVKQGSSALRRYEGKWGLKEGFTASLFSEEEKKRLHVEGYTEFESLVIRSVCTAIEGKGIEMKSPRTILIVSTTKGNVDLLRDGEGFVEEREYPGVAAKEIARYFGMVSEPVVVCNACISGVAALLLGKRLLESGEYDTAIVCGADCQNKFIVSGFQSFKALSGEECKPFDAERTGLNLGEGAATMVLSTIKESDISLGEGGICNDANHISAPSRTAEGSVRVLEKALGEDGGKVGLICMHGTATLYNDQMESVAIERCGLSDIPANSLKGYYGHTMGAAGVLETILSIASVKDHTVLGTRGLQNIGVPGRVSVTGEHRPTDTKEFIKMLSGFGGTNAAIRVKIGESEAELRESVNSEEPGRKGQRKVIHKVRITPDGAIVDGKEVETEGKGKEMLTNLYRQVAGDYPKFFKMDLFTRLAFVASELLLNAEGKDRSNIREDRGVVLFNRVSSLIADRQHQESIRDEENSFASPAVFVYTLPNITTGEIAIRNHYMAETSFYVLADKNKELMEKINRVTVESARLKSLITGWVDCMDENNFLAEIELQEIR